MIEMFVESLRLVLPDDLSVRVELNFPAFETDSIPASVVYQFDVPEAGNEEVFRYANCVEVLGKWREYDWRMSYGGIPLFTGKLVVLSVANGRFRCAATLRQLSSGFSDKMLTDFHFIPEFLVPSGSGVTDTHYIPSIEHDSFVLPPIYAPDLYSSNGAWSGYVNRFPAGDSGAYTEAAIPCFYVFKFIEKVFNTEGFGVDYDSSMAAVVLSLFRSLLFFNNHTLDTVPDGLESETVSTSALAYYQNRIYPENHVPAVSVSAVLMSLKQMFGCQTFVDNRSAMVQFILLDDILKSKELDLSALVLEDFEVVVNEPKGYVLQYNNEEFKTGFSDAPEYLTLSKAGVPWHSDILISVRSVNSYYKSARLEDVDAGGQVTASVEWTRVGDNFQAVKTNGGLNVCEEVKIEATPVSMIELGGEFLPYYKEAGVSARFSPDASKVDKLLFFYVTGDQFKRTGTSSDISPDGSVSPFRTSLKLGGSYGLYEKILKPWYDFIEQSNEYTFDLRVSVEDMLNIIPVFGFQNVQTQLQVRKIRIKNQVYIPKQFTFELTHTEIKCQAKLIKNDRG